MTGHWGRLGFVRDAGDRDKGAFPVAAHRSMLYGALASMRSSSTTAILSVILPTCSSQRACRFAFFEAISAFFTARLALVAGTVNSALSVNSAVFAGVATVKARRSLLRKSLSRLSIAVLCSSSDGSSPGIVR